MTDLVEFLTARLDEAEATTNGRYTANPLAPPVDVSMEGGWVTVSRHGSSIGQTMSQDEYVSTYLVPAPDKRTLADIAAKRAIIDEYVARDKDADLMLGPDCLRQREWSGLRLSVQLMATGYADRAGYRDEWKPLSTRTHP